MYGLSRSRSGKLTAQPYGGARTDRQHPAQYSLAGDPVLALALKIDATVKQARPDGWRGVQAKVNTIKTALLPLLSNDVDEVERIFRILFEYKANIDVHDD
ncbi:MAG: hypothetical protein ACRESZ_22400 [Methylococcales bacterium]